MKNICRLFEMGGECPARTSPMIDRFPDDFMFELSKKEMEDWRCQFGTSNGDKMGLRYKPMAFTE
jgi:hypothetical protein